MPPRLVSMEAGGGAQQSGGDYRCKLLRQQWGKAIQRSRCAWTMPRARAEERQPSREGG